MSTDLDGEALQAIERTFWDKLEGLTQEAINSAVGEYLSDGEVAALLERRDRLVTHFRSLIDQRGEPMVVFGY